MEQVARISGLDLRAALYCLECAGGCAGVTGMTARGWVCGQDRMELKDGPSDKAPDESRRQIEGSKGAHAGRGGRKEKRSKDKKRGNIKKKRRRRK